MVRIWDWLGHRGVSSFEGVPLGSSSWTTVSIILPPEDFLSPTVLQLGAVGTILEPSHTSERLVWFIVLTAVISPSIFPCGHVVSGTFCLLVMKINSRHKRPQDLGTAGIASPNPSFAVWLGGWLRWGGAVGLSAGHLSLITAARVSLAWSRLVLWVFYPPNPLYVLPNWWTNLQIRRRQLGRTFGAAPPHLTEILRRFPRAWGHLCGGRDWLTRRQETRERCFD